MCVLALVLEMPSKLPLRPQTPALHYAEINKAAQQSREPEQQEIVQRPIQTTAQHLPPPQELGRRSSKGAKVNTGLSEPARGRRTSASGSVLASGLGWMGGGVIGYAKPCGAARLPPPQKSVPARVPGASGQAAFRWSVRSRPTLRRSAVQRIVGAFWVVSRHSREKPAAEEPSVIQ
jgi:hypothetical protein